MKILLVTFYEPDALGVRYLASSLLPHRHTVHILQMKDWMEIVTDLRPETPPAWMFTAQGEVYLCGPDVNPMTEKEKEHFCAFVSEWRPDLVGFSIRGVFKELVVPMIPLVRSAYPDAFITCGGAGPTLEPEFFLNAGVDAVLRGEGEESIVELAAALRSGRNWRLLRNLSHKDNKTVTHNLMRPVIRSLDTLPPPADDPALFSCIEQDKHVRLPMSLCGLKTPSCFKEGHYAIMTSRGCLGRCAYCSVEALRQAYRDVPDTPRMRVRGLGNVMREIQEQKEKGATFIAFWDDFLIREPEALLSFLQEYKEKIALPFSAQFHPRQLEKHPELLEAAADAGITQFYFGIQSGSPRFCKNVYQRDFFAADYPGLISSIQNKNADTLIQFIGGNPLEKQEDFEETLRFIASIPFDATFRTATTIIYFYLKYIQDSPLLRAHPDLPSKPRSQNAWFRNALLIDIRFIATDGVFDPIYKRYGDAAQYQNIMELLDLRNKLYDETFHKFFMPEAARLNGQDVYYWGCGDLYHKNKNLLRELRPKALLLDIPYSGPAEIDGIPVLHPQEVTDAPLPVLLFSGRPSFIYRKIQRDYPLFSDVVPCPQVIRQPPET